MGPSPESCFSGSSASPYKEIDLFDSDEYYEDDVIEMNQSASPYKEIDLYDSDGYYEDGVREMNREETNRYYEALQQSDGFDVPTFPKTYAIGLIVPISEPQLTREIRVCAEEAIKQYNMENGTNFEFLKIVKANQQPACGILYFITLEVKQIGTPEEFPTTTFEARVLAGLDDVIEVELCRPKRSS